MAKFKTLKLDIHGLNEVDAYCSLLTTLNETGGNVKTILVVHGFHGGTVLKDMVANFYHYKISWIENSIGNGGETLIHLK